MTAAEQKLADTSPGGASTAIDEAAGRSGPASGYRGGPGG